MLQISLSSSRGALNLKTNKKKVCFNHSVLPLHFLTLPAAHLSGFCACVPLRQPHADSLFPKFSAGFWRYCAGKRTTAMLSRSSLPAKRPCQRSLSAAHQGSMNFLPLLSASFPYWYPRSYEKSTATESCQQRTAGEVLPADSKSQY